MRFVIAIIAAIGATFIVAMIAIDHLHPVAEVLLEAFTPYIGASNFAVVAAELFMPMFPILAPMATFIIVFIGAMLLLKNGGRI